MPLVVNICRWNLHKCPRRFRVCEFRSLSPIGPGFVSFFAMPNSAIYRWFWSEIRLTTLRSGAPVSFPNIYEAANKAFSGYCACGKNPVSRQKEKGSSGSLQLELLNKLWNRNSVKQCKNYSTTIKTRDQEMMGIQEKSFRRLPKNVRPSHYDITLVPDMTKFIFHGTENVHISVSSFNADRSL